MYCIVLFYIVQKKVSQDDSEDDSDLDTCHMEVENVPRRAPTGRAKVPVKYNFDDSDDDDFDDDF